MSIARHHTEWLSLIEISGPFVSLPVLSKVFPQGLDERDPEKARNLRSTFEAYQEAPNNLAAQLAWVKFVLSDTLSFYPEHLKEGQEIPPGLKAELLEHRETLRPDVAVVVPRTSDSGEKVQQTQLLVSVYLKDQDLDAPIKGTHWKASPATRMAELLHASDVPLGLVTNGERWMLVYAPRGETTGFTSWYASLWFEEPKTLRAFHSLLSLQRVVGSADTLLSMLRESASDQQEVTDKLGRQVRDAVDVLVSAFSRLNIDAQGKLLEGISEKELYNAALTVMMRLVFLFCAEERGMLHLGKPLYDNNYAVSTLREQLQEDADQHGEEVLERRSDAWVRLLATFRAVYGGVTHEDLSLPAYGGSLFNPDRYAFLEGRPVGTEWTTSEAAPPKIDNRVVLHLLRSLQMLQDRDTKEARRLSFRALDIEQIGHVYEGLLDHTAVRAEKTMLGLEGSKKLEPMRSLEELEAELAKGEASFLKYLKETTGRSESALKKALNSILLVDTHKLMISCHNNESLFDRVLPFAGLLRQDSFEMPLVILKGSVFVTSGTDRRSSGTHYTPRTLTEPVVKNTLEPLVYLGPAEGLPREEWKLKSPREILELKVCDMAMGSGAFLTEACRYLAERLVEAWEQGEKEHPEAIMVTPEGDFSRGIYSERVLPKDMGERITIAKRLIADRCLYGVDINPMAVEMAKLSLWLITLQKDRPFGFLDHAFKSGDSLIGIVNQNQLNYASLTNHNEINLSIALSADAINTAVMKRRALEKINSENELQIREKIRIFNESEDILKRLKDFANNVVFIEYFLDNESERNESKFSLGMSILENRNIPPVISSNGNGQLPVVFNWVLEFPEVFHEGGFSCIIGNPPFVGGKKISTVLGDKYLAFLKKLNPYSSTTTDICAYFLFRAFSLIKNPGYLGMILTNSIAQGDSRQASLLPLTSKFSAKIFRAISSMQWPGSAALEVSVVHLTNSSWHGKYYLNDKEHSSISSALSDEDLSIGEPQKLSSNRNLSFSGANIMGIGFTIEPEQALNLLESEKNQEVIFPFLNGADVNSTPESLPSRYVINFHDFPLTRISEESWLQLTDEERSQSIKAGYHSPHYERPVASDYPDCLDLVERFVKPERFNLKDNADGKRYKSAWWKFGRPSTGLNETIRSKNLSRVLVIPLTSKYLNVVWQPSNIVFSHAVGVIASDSDGMFALLQSSVHEVWARSKGSTLENRLRYTPSDVFETFPLPDYTSLNEVGKKYYSHRLSICIKYGIGLTELYNRFHDPNYSDTLIDELRSLHKEMDYMVCKSYNLSIDLEHSFYNSSNRQSGDFSVNDFRFSISHQSKNTILRKILSLNHERFRSEDIDASSRNSKRSKGKYPDDKKTGNPQSGLF